MVSFKFIAEINNHTCKICHAFVLPHPNPIFFHTMFMPIYPYFALFGIMSTVFNSKFPLLDPRKIIFFFYFPIIVGSYMKVHNH